MVRHRDVMGKMRKRRKFFKLFSCLGRSQNDDPVQDDGISCSASSPAVAATGSAADELASVTKTGAAASCPHNMFRYTWSSTAASHTSVGHYSHVNLKTTSLSTTDNVVSLLVIMLL